MGQCSSRCPSDACHWKLFKHDNFEGNYNDMCQNSGEKTYTGQGSWANWQFKNDDVSSASFMSHEDYTCYYEMRQHSDGTGWRLSVIAQEGHCCDYRLSELEARGFVV